MILGSKQIAVSISISVSIMIDFDSPLGQRNIAHSVGHFCLVGLVPGVHLKSYILKRTVNVGTAVYRFLNVHYAQGQCFPTAHASLIEQLTEDGISMIVVVSTFKQVIKFICLQELITSRVGTFTWSIGTRLSAGLRSR